MEGIVINKDRIPIIFEILDQLKNHFNGENLDNATTFVQNNKHNQVTSTYYLLLKKKERQTGKNYVYEQVTFEKRKNLYSTSNLKQKRADLEPLGMAAMSGSGHQFYQKGNSYCKSEGRPTLESEQKK